MFYIFHFLFWAAHIFFCTSPAVGSFDKLQHFLSLQGWLQFSWRIFLPFLASSNYIISFFMSWFFIFSNFFFISNYLSIPYVTSCIFNCILFLLTIFNSVRFQLGTGKWFGIFSISMFDYAFLFLMYSSCSSWQKPFFSNFGAIITFAIFGTFIASVVTGVLV